jgi:3',5'-cyclic AMP phosphodiesterase CpdA
LNPDFGVLDFDNPDFAAVAGDACEDDGFEDDELEDNDFEEAFDILAAKPFPFFNLPANGSNHQ